MGVYANRETDLTGVPTPWVPGNGKEIITVSLRHWAMVMLGLPIRIHTKSTMCHDVPCPHRAVSALCADASAGTHPRLARIGDQGSKHVLFVSILCLQ